MESNQKSLFDYIFHGIKVNFNKIFRFIKKYGVSIIIIWIWYGFIVGIQMMFFSILTNFTMIITMIGFYFFNYGFGMLLSYVSGVDKPGLYFPSRKYKGIILHFAINFIFLGLVMNTKFWLIVILLPLMLTGFIIKLIMALLSYITMIVVGIGLSILIIPWEILELVLPVFNAQFVDIWEFVFSTIKNTYGFWDNIGDSIRELIFRQYSNTREHANTFEFFFYKPKTEYWGIIAFNFWGALVIFLLSSSLILGHYTRYYLHVISKDQKIEEKKTRVIYDDQ